MREEGFMDVNTNQLHQLLDKVVGDLGGAASGALVLLGDMLGLFKSLAAGGAQTPAQRSRLTKTNERLVREWLNGIAASGYESYEPEERHFLLTPEQQMAFAQEDSPAFMPGGI